MTNLILTAAIKGTIVLCAAWIATALLRQRSADLRHRIWLAALVAFALTADPDCSSADHADTSSIRRLRASEPRRASARSVSVLPILWSVIAALLFCAGARGSSGCTASRGDRDSKWLSRERRHPHSDDLGRDPAGDPAAGVYRGLARGAARGCPDPHERAHIQRHDWVWQGFAQVMTAVFWFHPLVWLAAAQMRQEAEHAADDATLAQASRLPIMPTG